MLKATPAACAAAVLAIALCGTAHAQAPADYRTYFTFSQPVTLPGVTLPAGRYLFRLADTAGTRRVVQVLSEDGRQAYAMLMAIPAQRPQAPADPEIRFMETPADTPAAIKTWWYPGNAIGWEFIYPKEQALRLARASTQPVLTTAQAEPATTEQMRTADLSRVSSAGEQAAVTAVETPDAAAPSGDAQVGEVASAALSIPASPTPAAVTAASQAASASPRVALPRTASAWPWVLLAATASLAAGAGLRLVGRRG